MGDAPALPTGLQFGTANGTTWGTPTALARTTYTIWGNNTGGSVNVTFNLTVVHQIPDAIDLTDVDLRATNNTAWRRSSSTAHRAQHSVGDLTEPACRTGVRHEQWDDLGHADGLIPRTEFTSGATTRVVRSTARST